MEAIAGTRLFQPTVALALALMAIISMMVLPMPSWMLDIGLSVSFALAILIFYTFPIMTSVYSWATGREPVTLPGVAAVIVTRGGSGLTVFTGDGSRNVGAPTVEIVDTVGAGDTIVAAVLASLWEASIVDRPALDSLTLDRWEAFTGRAVAAAALTCSRPGADPPTRDELAW